jgi:hypothetical protein
MAREAVRKSQRSRAAGGKRARCLRRASWLKISQRDAPQHQDRVSARLTGLCREHNDPPEGSAGREDGADDLLGRL